MKNWVAEGIASDLNDFTTQGPQLSQPRPNLLANEPPTTLTPNFEDVEQPPPSYEECMAQRNDLPPKYEDLELPPPAYQETMV